MSGRCRSPPGSWLPGRGGSRPLPALPAREPPEQVRPRGSGRAGRLCRVCCRSWRPPGCDAGAPRPRDGRGWIPGPGSGWRAQPERAGARRAPRRGFPRGSSAGASREEKKGGGGGGEDSRGVWKSLPCSSPSPAASRAALALPVQPLLPAVFTGGFFFLSLPVSKGLTVGTKAGTDGA